MIILNENDPIWTNTPANVWHIAPLNFWLRSISSKDVGSGKRARKASKEPTEKLPATLKSIDPRGLVSSQGNEFGSSADSQTTLTNASAS